VSGYLKLTVLLAGAATLGAEVAAPRLLAPSFGTTQIVWTNIIGTVLAALTAGAFVGGRFADRWPRERAYARVLLAAGVSIASVPFLSEPLLAKAALAVGREEVGALLGSMALCCLLFAPPVFLLGMVAPWAVRLGGAGRPDLGRVAGLLYGLGSLGSILGTFATSLVAIPALGTRRTLLVAGGLLALAGAWRAGPRHRELLLVAAGLGLGFWVLSTAARDPEVLYAKESLYQSVQVVRDGGGVSLRLNEGLGIESFRPDQGVLTGGVWDLLSALPALRPRSSGGLHVLVAGLAGGTVATQIEALYHDRRPLTIDGVELDPVVVEAGRRFFGLDALESLRIHTGDARPFLAAHTGPYDVIIVDAYRGSYVPFHLATREFYALCRERLVPGGLLGVNLASAPTAKTLVDALGATLREVFPQVVRLDLVTPGALFGNHVFVASEAPFGPPRAAVLPPELARRVTIAFQRGEWLGAPPPGARVLTDDRAPVELLTDASILWLLWAGH
jgi:spermidine synthase